MYVYVYVCVCIYIYIVVENIETGLPSSSAGKEPTCLVGDPSLIPSSGRSPGEGIGYPLHYCLENPHGQRSLGGYYLEGSLRT